MYDNVMSVLRNRWVQFIGVLLVLAMAGYLFYLITPLLIPVILAFLVAYLLSPVVAFLEARTPLSRTLATSGLGLIAVLIVIAVPVLLVPRLIDQAERLVAQARASIQAAADPDRDQEDAFLGTLIDWLPLEHFVRTMGWWPPQEVEAEGVQVRVGTSLDDEFRGVDVEVEAGPDVVAAPPAAGPVTVGGSAPPEAGAPASTQVAVTVPATDRPDPDPEDYPPLTDEIARAVIAERIGTSVRENVQAFTRYYASSALGALRTGGASLADFLGTLWQSIVWVLAFLVGFSIFAFATGYLLISFDSLIEHSKDLVPDRHKQKTFDVVGRIDQQLRSFVRGQVLASSAEAVLYSIGLSIAQVPFAVPLGIAIGFLTIIPYLGVTIGILVSGLLALVAHGIDWHILAVLITFGVVQTVEEAFLKPVIVGDKVGLHPVWVMMAFLVFGNALGFLGILLAVPIAASLKVLVMEAFEYYQHSKLYRANPGPDTAGPNPSG